MNPVRLLLSKLSKHLSPNVDPRIQDKAIKIVAPPMKNGRGITKLFPPKDTLELSADQAYKKKEQSRLRLVAEGYLGAAILALGLNGIGLVNGQHAFPFATAMGSLATYARARAWKTGRDLKILEESIKGYKFSVKGNDISVEGSDISVEGSDKIAVLNQLPKFRTPVSEASIEYYDLTHGHFKEAAYEKIPNSNVVQGSIQDGYYFPAGTDLTRYPITLKAGESRTYSIDGYGEITLQPGEKADAFIWEWIKTLGSENTKATREQSIPLLKNPVISSYQFDYGAEESAKFDQALENSFQRRVQKKS
jgi:hypothetical protein